MATHRAAVALRGHTVDTLTAARHLGVLGYGGSENNEVEGEGESVMDRREYCKDRGNVK